MRRARLAPTSCLLILILGRSQSLPAQIPHRPPNAVDSIATKEWLKRLHAVDQDLRAARWHPAKRACERLLQEMENHLQGGVGAAAMLGTTVLFKAIAESGLGQSEDALWDWSTGVTLHPALRDTDVSAYGEAAAVLTRHSGATSPETRRPDWAPRKGELWLVGETKEGKTIAKPEKLVAEPPRYPPGLRRECASGAVEVDSIIDESGKVTPDFEVPLAASPVMELMALEALRSWRFKPATLDGKPVKVYYSLTVTFSARGCVPHP